MTQDQAGHAFSRVSQSVAVQTKASSPDLYIGLIAGDVVFFLAFEKNTFFAGVTVLFELFHNKERLNGAKSQICRYPKL